MTEDVDPVKVLHDAVEKHHLHIEPSDPRLKALVSYAIAVGYQAGWHDHKTLMTDATREPPLQQIQGIKDPLPSKE